MAQLSLFICVFLSFSTMGNGFLLQDEDDLILPDPHIVILGPTGVGKSCLACVLIGGSPEDEGNCTFEICSGADSCTKETSYAVGNFVSNGILFTVVDTPGFGDTDNDDNELIDEMIDVLKNVIKTANSLIILFNGESERFDANVQQMLREMEALFGKETFWSHSIMGVSHWSYKESEQQERNYTGHDEDWWTWEMNQQLQEKFHLDFNLTSVFIDCYAKMPFNVEDPFQQEAFDRETSKLWELTQSMEPFEFKTIEDILSELTECKTTMEMNITELWRAIEVLEESVEVNSADIVHNSEAISRNSIGISSNSQNITNLSGDVSKNSLDILEISAELEEVRDDVGANTLDISGNRADIDLNTAAISESGASLISVMTELESVDQSVDSHSANILKNSQDIITNSVAISVTDRNVSDLSEDVRKNSQDILEMSMEQGGIRDDIIGLSFELGEVKDDVGANTVDIANNRADIDLHAAEFNSSLAAVKSEFDEAYLQLLPVGSIVPWVPRPNNDAAWSAWVPDNWQLCDGLPIARGEWQGEPTPDLTNKFLRGGTGATVLAFEEGMIKDHEHVDNRHTHAESGDGHTHIDSGHTHTFGDNTLKDGGNSIADARDNRYVQWSEPSTTDSGKANLQKSKVTLDTTTSNIKGVNSATATTGAETRPENMRVLYIMRIA